jgi:hypothetical protein
MSDYIRTIIFADKDALLAGDANKVVRGAEVDVELDAASSAISSKYDASDLASQIEAETGTDNTKLMTPLRVSQQVATIPTGDAATLQGQDGSFYQNSDNQNAGTLPSGRLTGSYDIDVTGNAATADAATTAGSATSATTATSSDDSAKWGGYNIVVGPDVGAANTIYFVPE